MTKGRYFLGETTDPDQAFPGIIALDVKVTQDPFGYYTEKESQRVAHFTKENILAHLRCANRRCQQGGLDLQRLVLFSPSGEQSYWCGGHEGSPAGRKQGDPCENRFDVVMSVNREDKVPPAA